jgi:hypothetical protein
MPAPQAGNKGITNLVVRLPKQTASQTITVLFSRPEDRVTPPLRPLASWR